MTESQSAPQAANELNPVVSGLWLTLSLALGFIPSVGFYAWIERNCTLPILPLQLGWPWVDGALWPVPMKLLWNAGLFAAFGRNGDNQYWNRCFSWRRGFGKRGLQQVQLKERALPNVPSEIGR